MRIMILSDRTKIINTNKMNKKIKISDQELSNLTKAMLSIGVIVGAVKIDLEHIEESLSEDGVAEARGYVRYAMDKVNQLDKVLKRIK